MLIIRGVNAFPLQIESVLMWIDEVQPHYQLVVTREKGLDELEVWVEVEERLFSDEVKALEALEEKIRSELEGVVGLTVKVKPVEPNTTERSMGKAKRVVDKRRI